MTTTRSLCFSLLRLAVALCCFSLVGIGCDDKPAKNEQDLLDQTDQTETDTQVEPDTTQPDTQDPDTGDVSACPAGLNGCLDEFGRPRRTLCADEQVCNATTGCCELPFRCQTHADCEANRPLHRDCPDATLACLCNTQTGGCYAFICSGGSDCEAGQVCANGACVDAPATSALVARIVTPARVLVVGSDLNLEVIAVDPNNPAIAMSTGVTFAFESDATAVATVSAAGLIEALAAGQVTVTAKVSDNAADPGDTITLPVIAASSDALRVLVYNEHTGEHVADGVSVWVTDGNGATTSVATASGVAGFGPTVVFPVDISIFDEAYTYLTLTAIEPASGETAVDVFVPVSPVTLAEVTQKADKTGFDFQLQNVGAVTGKVDFANVRDSGEIEVALTGVSLSSSLFELDLDLIIGPNIEQELPDTSPVQVQGLVEIPSGVTLGFGESAIVEKYVAVGEPPVRTMWSVGGRVSLFENPNLITDIVDQADSQDMGAIVAAILPFFRDFYSGLSPDLVFEPGVSDEIDNVLTVPTDIETLIPVGPLSTTSDGVQDLALVIGGVTVPGQGFLPLGLTAGVAQKDAGGAYTGLYDGDPTTRDIAEPITLNLAPAHSGLEGRARYTVVLAGLHVSGGGPVRTTGVVGRLPASQAVPAEMPLPRADFPALPEGSAYDATTRTVTIALPSGETPAVVRVILEASSGNRWVVYAPAGTSSIVLPDPSAIACAADRANDNISVSTLSFAESTLDYQGLVAADGWRLNNLIDIVSQFTIYQIR